ncbi:MAG: oleate hydratase [Anaerostipes hadrus]
MKLFFTANEKLYDKTIEMSLTNMFLILISGWRTMFAFENWHSALEMKLYLQRLTHHTVDCLIFRFEIHKYNQYESLILPMVEYLKQNGVIFHFHTQVTNVIFPLKRSKIAKVLNISK